MNFSIDKLKYSKSFERIKEIGFLKILEITCVLICMFLLSNCFTELSKLNSKFASSSVTNEKTMEEENIEKHTKRMLVELEAKVSDLNQNTKNLETLMTEANFDDMKKEIRKLGDIQQSLISIMDVEEDTSKETKK